MLSETLGQISRMVLKRKDIGSIYLCPAGITIQCYHQLPCCGLKQQPLQQEQNKSLKNKSRSYFSNITNKFFSLPCDINSQISQVPSVQWGTYMLRLVIIWKITVLFMMQKLSVGAGQQHVGNGVVAVVIDSDKCFLLQSEVNIIPSSLSIKNKP